MYVPYWLYDCSAEYDGSFKATRIRKWSDSRYHYTKTDHYLLRRRARAAFAGIPMDGSSKMEDAFMESIEPFDLSEAVDFNTAYLAGYLADRYDVDSGESIQRANERIRKSTADTFAETAGGYTTIIPVSTGIQLKNGCAKYALYPVWLLNTTWNGKKYTFAMNGQTGKMVGDLPMDKAAYKRWLFGIAGVVTAVCLGVSYLLWLL
jgi:hypothetical protein